MKVAIVGDVHLMATSPRSWKVSYLEETLRELDEVVRRHDVTICLGDFLHRPVLPTVQELAILRYLKEWRQQGRMFHSLIGNHDVFNMNIVAGLEASKLAIFDHAEGVTLLNDTKISISGVGFTVLPMRRDPQVPEVDPQSGKYRFLLGHFYFDSAGSLDPHMTIMAEDLMGKGYTHVFLGHDHEPYKTVKLLDGCRVVRPGALGRNTAHPFNLSRVPRYLSMEIESGEVSNLKFVEVECAAKGADIFCEEVFTQAGPKNNETFQSSLDDVIACLGKVGEKRDLTLKGALQALGASEETLSYLDGVAGESGLVFA